MPGEFLKAWSAFNDMQKDWKHLAFGPKWQQQITIKLLR